MSDSATELNLHSSEYFLSAANIQLADHTVGTVFQMMFGIGVEAIEPAEGESRRDDVDDRTALIGFSGVLRGSCQIRMSSGAARSIASAMLGGTPVEDDDSLDDALGELCNMVAGGWKDGIPALSADCSLSPPTVISGRDYKVHVHKPSWRLSRSYRFESESMQLILCCEEDAA